MFTADEERQLERYEQTIEWGLHTFYEVGQALAAIRDGRLYRQTHDTFEAYCQDRWEFSDRRARQMIEAAQVAAELEEPKEDQTGTMVPEPLTQPRTLLRSERQVRELTRIEPELRRQVWQQAVAQANGKPTAKVIRKIVNAKTGKPPGTGRRRRSHRRR